MTENTTTALAIVEGGKHPKPAMVAGAAPRAIVPVSFEEAYRIADVVIAAGMAPKTLETVPKAMVAILHGLEVGLTPMNALQSIAVINGRPSIWGDGAIGLIRASGLLEYMKEEIIGEGDAMKAVCVVKRKGEPSEIKGEFSVADAKRASLWDDKPIVKRRSKDGGWYEKDNDSPWYKYPKRMLQMRARWPLRDGFADVLRGLALREEMEDIERSQTAAQIPQAVIVPPAPPEPPAPPPPPGQAVAPPQAAPDPLDIHPALRREAKPLPETPLPEAEIQWIRDLAGTLSGCGDLTDLAEKQEAIMAPMKGKVSATAWARAEELVTEYVDQIGIIGD